MQSRKKKPPQIGDRIEHTCRLNGKFEGVVIEMLSTQFVYKTDNGHDRFCLFREDWKHIEK